jgi:hypothetical protein
MDTQGPHLLHRVRTTGHRLFHRFGLYVNNYSLTRLSLNRFMVLVVNKALRNASNSRHPYLCRRHHLTFLSRPRHLFVLPAPLPCPLFLPNP